MIWSKERIQEILNLFGQKYEQAGEKLTEQDAVEILDNLAKFAEILVERDIQYKKRDRKKALPALELKASIDKNKLVDVEEMAKILRVPSSWIYSRTRLETGEIPFIRVGKYLRFNPGEVVEYFKNLS